MNNTTKEVCQRIDWIRRQQGLNQEQLARTLNISQAAISLYLRDRIPPAMTLLKLADLGQTTIEWILTGQKSYFYETVRETVHEAGATYDADWALARKIASLPAEVRQAILLIIGSIKD